MSINRQWPKIAEAEGCAITKLQSQFREKKEEKKISVTAKNHEAEGCAITKL